MLQSTDNALRDRFFHVHAGSAYWLNVEAEFPPFPVKREEEVPPYPLWELLEGSSDEED